MQSSNGRPDDLRRHTTAAGITIRLKPVSSLYAREIVAAHPDPEPPTYTIVTVAGTEETHPLDETMLDSDERKAAWAAYQRALRNAKEQRDLLLLDFFLLEGIECDLPDNLEVYRRRWQRYGLAVPDPDDEDGLRLAYLKRHVVTTTEDLIAIQAKIGELSGLTEGALKRVQAMFQRPLAQHSAAQPGAAPKRLDDEPDSVGDAGRAELGDLAAEPLLRANSPRSGAGGGDLSDPLTDGGLGQRAPTPQAGGGEWPF